MSTITTNPASAATSTAPSAGDQKDWTDFLGGILPDLGGRVAQEFGLDPRLAGQTVSQILNIFGIGGTKGFSPSLNTKEAVTQLQQVVSPHLSDPVFAKALGAWMKAAIEPVQAQKEGKDYQPSVDLSKNWFTDAVDWVGDQASHVNWQQVAQVGMQALPFVLSVL